MSPILHTSRERGTVAKDQRVVVTGLSLVTLTKSILASNG